VNVRIVTLGLAVLSLVGCSEDPEPPATAKGHSTPEAVCAVFFAAVESRDFRSAVACLAPESVEKMARSFAWQGLDHRDELERTWAKSWHKPNKKEEEEAQRRSDTRLSEVLDRHGLTRRVAADLKARPTEQAARDALATLIRDPAGLVADYLQLTHKTDPRWRRDRAPRPYLDEVSIAFGGRTATGQVVFPYSFVDKGERRDNKQPVKFVKVARGDWRLVLSSTRYLVP
jgi:hypothetical protein